MVNNGSGTIGVSSSKVIFFGDNGRIIGDGTSGERWTNSHLILNYFLGILESPIIKEIVGSKFVHVFFRVKNVVVVEGGNTVELSSVLEKG